eukprot:TRINITY_DN4066_c0_g1_i1.p1 TRINITY_DN4066_c0_g1~~TRINITY_DN4066_c0_g1_i1.p1  ORF type:complete len:325 (-),score=72.15 TRINITY_DN4066_c0_g1_i1:52-945(-)
MTTTKKLPMWQGFLIGSLGAMNGGAVGHPFDLLKVRLQIQGEGGGRKMGMLSMSKLIWADEGFKGFFRGLSASLIRQAVYSGIRFGSYDVLKKLFGETEDKPLPLYAKIPAAVIAGSVGAFIGNPADLAMVRMQADGKLPLDQRRNYKNAFDALIRVVKEEGVLTLWRGVNATVTRAIFITIGQIAAYDQIKEQLLRTSFFEDNVITHFTASIGAAFCASVLSNPLDVIKTRLMNMKSEGGVRAYNGFMDCLLKTVKSEGLFALYKGFIPTFVRQSPYVIVTWITIEQLKKIASKLN